MSFPNDTHTHTQSVSRQTWTPTYPTPGSVGREDGTAAAVQQLEKPDPKGRALPAGPPAGREAVVKKRCEINGRRTKKQNLALISEHTIYLVRTHTHKPARAPRLAGPSS